MKDSVKATVRQVLTSYIEENKLRKTPERFAVLDAVYSFNGYFNINDLNEKLESANFYVSRATLYNHLKLFQKLRLLVSLRLMGGTYYEASQANENHCRQICTRCGKVTEVKSSLITKAVEDTHLKRFRREHFTMYIYGVCSTCQGLITKQKRKKTIKNKTSK